MIMARNEDGTYSQVGFVKDNVGIDTEYIYDKDGDIVFEKGFTREINGEVPLTINGIGKDLKDWSITGNTVQNGTPTPENPVEVQAVGDRTGNLFNGTIGIDNVILSQYGNLAPNDSYALSEYIPVEPNMSYIYHFYHNIAENRSTYSICEYDSNQNVIQPLTVQWITENRDYNISFTTQANTAYIRINWKKAPDDDLMLITGSTALPYEPYGYKIPVVTRGKNLISKIIKNSNLNSNGSIFKAEKYNLGVAKVEPNKTYCFYVDDEEVSVYGFFANEPEINSITIDGNRYIAQMNTKISVTVPSNANFIVIRRIGNFDSFQLEEGSTVTPYEPYHEPITTPIYLDKPLYKIGDYADSLSKTEEVRIVKELVLTGNEHFNIDTNLRFSIYVADIKTATNRTGRSYCSHYECLYHAEPYDDDWNNVYYQNGGTLYFHDKRFVTVTGFKEYLAAQHAAGTPVTVWYQLVKPTTETFTAPQIPTLNGTTVIDVDTAVKPTEIYTKYKSSK